MSCGHSLKAVAGLGCCQERQGRQAGGWGFKSGQATSKEGWEIYRTCLPECIHACMYGAERTRLHLHRLSPTSVPPHQQPVSSDTTTSASSRPHQSAVTAAPSSQASLPFARPSTAGSASPRRPSSGLTAARDALAALGTESSALSWWKRARSSKRSSRPRPRPSPRRSKAARRQPASHGRDLALYLRPVMPFVIAADAVAIERDRFLFA